MYFFSCYSVFVDEHTGVTEKHVAKKKQKKGDKLSDCCQINSSVAFQLLFLNLQLWKGMFKIIFAMAIFPSNLKSFSFTRSNYAPH